MGKAIIITDMAESCTEFTCKEPCEFHSQYGFCHDRCMKLHVCVYCCNWKNPRKEVKEHV